MNFLLTILSAFVLGTILLKLKIPGGMLIGGIFGVILLNLATHRAYMPYEAKLFAQMISGAFIGVGITKESIDGMKKLAKPLAIVLSCFLILNISMGFILSAISDMDLITAMMSCTPGGMTDVTIIASEMGGDTATIVLMQFIRLVTSLGVFPSIIKFFGRHEGDFESEDDSVSVERTKYSHRGLAIAMLAAFIGGMIGTYVDIAGGTLIFAILATILAKRYFNEATLPKIAVRIAQVFAGAYIGTTISVDSLGNLRYVFFPALVMMIGYFIACVIMSKLLQKYCGFGIKESMLASIPAGASDMALISVDMGVRSPKLAIMQITRMLVVISVFTQVIAVVVHSFSG